MELNNAFKPVKIGSISDIEKNNNYKKMINSILKNTFIFSFF